ncbi:MFS transporter [Nocardioides sp. LS1]|uniref:MFS transporter n=1 Tax=Nocardioides sp. LS1 TaxID=1027620 RepID=UPI000F6212A3|nr:MFS transporter [Nocardioides sp. LS1]GCD88140.1 MFS transporter [Nocardioides sp. LS1]
MDQFETTVGLAEVAPTRVAASSPGALIAVAALLATVTNAVAFMLPPLLPVITTSYAHNSVSAATWVFTALTLGGGAGFVLIPRLTDILSDRSTTLMSGGFLTGGALVAAIGDNYAGLVVGSVLLGFGGAAQLVPLSFLRRHLPGNGVSTAVMVLIMATGSGVVLGMVGGGISVRLWPLPDHLNADGSLPSLSIAPFYYLLAALFVITTIALLVVVPNSPPESTGRIGLLGTVWLIGWVTLILLAFSAPTDSTIGKNATLILLIGIVAAVGWVFAERRSERPVFDLAVLRKPFVTTACISAGLFGCVDAAFLVLSNYYVQNPNGLPVSTDGGQTGWPPHVAQYGLTYDPLKTSLIMLPFALTMFISGKYSEKIISRGRPGIVLVGGAVICLVGLWFLAVAHDQAWEYVVGSGIIGLGSRAGYSGAFAVPQFVVPQTEAGMAAGMPGTIMAIGFAVGAAVVTVLQNGSGFVYHSVDVANMVAGKLDPAKVNLTMSDYLLEGTHIPSADVYTTGYYVAMIFPALVIVAAIVSRLRNRDGFQKLLEEQGA